MSPCKETAASHSGHCAMIGFSFYLVWIANLVQKYYLSTQLTVGRHDSVVVGSHFKNLDKQKSPSSSKGRRAFMQLPWYHLDLPTPHDVKPLRVLTYSSPITVASGKGLISSMERLCSIAISSCSLGFLFTTVYNGL